MVHIFRKRNGGSIINNGKATTMKKWVSAVLVIATVIALIRSVEVEGAIGIDLNPCTLPHCIAACKRVLEDKFLTATCALGPNGKYRICLG